MIVTRTITSVERQPKRRSRNGNPCFLVKFQDAPDALTAPDSMVAYVIENSEYHNVPVRVTFEPRPADWRIVDVRPVEGK